MIKARGLVDYFCVCGLDAKGGLESEPSTATSAIMAADSSGKFGMTLLLSIIIIIIMTLLH
jgi:hypothetical protein